MISFSFSHVRISLSESTGKLFAIIKPTTPVSSREYIYALATYRDDTMAEGNKYQTVVRISARDLLAMNLENCMEIMASSNNLSTAFIPLRFDDVQPKKLFSILDLTEGSLWYDAATNQWHVIYVHYLEKYFKLCSSPRIFLSSGISAPESIFGTNSSIGWQCNDIAEVESKWYNDHNIWSYAGKSHPVLLSSMYKSCCERSRNSVMILSMVSNALHGYRLLYTPKYKEMYTPKFHLIEKKFNRS